MNDQKRKAVVGQRLMSLEEIKLKAAQNAAQGRSLLPFDRMRKERGAVLDPGSSPSEHSPAAEVENAVANMGSLTLPGTTITVDPNAGVLTLKEEPDAPPLPQFTGVLPSVPVTPPAMPDEPMSTTPWIDELAHATIQIAFWEKKIGQPIMIVFQDGRKERLGDLLIKLGEYLMEEERKKIAPRILLPGSFDS
jgi:hypothetical protein